MKTDEFCTVRQVAKRLLVCPQTVHNWIRQGRVKAMKVGRHYRIPASEVDRLLTDSEGSK